MIGRKRIESETMPVMWKRWMETMMKGRRMEMVAGGTESTASGAGCPQAQTHEFHPIRSWV